MSRKVVLNNSGFTLLEVMLAAGILIFAIAAVLTGFIYTAVQVTANQNMAVAITDGQHVLEKLKDATYSSIAGYTDTNFTSLSNESIRVTVTTAGNIKLVLANVTWLEGRRLRNYVLQTQIAW